MPVDVVISDENKSPFDKLLRWLQPCYPLAQGDEIDMHFLHLTS